VDLEKYRLLFVDEATEHLVEMSRALCVLGEGGRPEERGEAIDTLFRMTHSIKGMAASLDYDAASSLAHGLEDWLQPLRSEGTLPEDGMPLLYEAVRALEQMVTVVSEEGSPPRPREDLLARLGEPLGLSEAMPSQQTPEEQARGVAPPPLPRSVRVRTQAIDRFLAGVGELGQRQSCLEALHRAAPLWELHREFGDELYGMARVFRELRRDVMDIRLTPVRRVLERLPRVAGELAHGLGKKVRVELAGEEVEADRAVLDHLDEPLLHLVRNAVDHGLETPEERKRANKDPVGCIRLSASAASGRLHVRLEEDGRGIDVEAVRRRAIDRGLLLEPVAEDLPPERIFELIFEPGISTRDEVTTVSGRGVGLDAVKRTIESLGGTVSVESQPGRGTAFEIELSSMVALQRVLVLEISGERVALPVTPVEAVLAVGEGRVERAGGEAFFVWKDEPIPLIDLAERLVLAPPPVDRAGNVVVLDVRGFRLGLRIDRAVSDLEVFVREVPPVLSQLKPLGGVAILPDGVPVFLLEVGALVEPFV
jgi:two-component system chemotaxis sensor kinase CheA